MDAVTEALPDVWRVTCEITDNCQLECSFCYADSGPKGTHGKLTTADWLGIIGQAADLGALEIQFIGGEPTRHPGLKSMIQAARARGLDVEVASNLVAVSNELWEVFVEAEVRLATTYLSNLPEVHDKLTRRTGSHANTRRHIAEAVNRGIWIRIGIIGSEDRAATEQDLISLGVPAGNILADIVRKVGRALPSGADEDMSQLCGRCGKGWIVVTPNGDVLPCTFARKLIGGNAITHSLAEIAKSAQMAGVLARLDAEFASRPSACSPNGDGSPHCEVPNQSVPHRVARLTGLSRNAPLR